MKKLLTSLLFLIALCVSTATAQEEGRLGVRVLWDLNSPSTNLNEYTDVFGNGSGFSLGAFYTIPVYHALYVEPGLSIFYNTIGIPDINVGEPAVAGPKLVSGSLRNFGFRIPLVAGYRFDFTDDIALSVFTGPQLNIGLSLKEHISIPGQGTSSEQLYGEGYHRLDMQWLFGVRFHYNNKFIAEISGGPGMTNIMGGKANKGSYLRRNIVSVGVGYIF